MTSNQPPPAARRWPWTRVLKWTSFALAGVILAAILGFYGYHWIEDLLYNPKPKTVSAQHPELGVIKLVPAKTEDGIPGWIAHFHLDVPPETVWNTFRDCRNLAVALKGVGSCTVLEKGPDYEIQKMTLTHASDAYLKVKSFFEPVKLRSQWRMIEGSFVAAAGSMQVWPLPGHRSWSRVQYAYYINISPLLPKSFERKRNMKSVRNMARDIQRFFRRKPTPAGRASPVQAGPRPSRAAR